MKAWVAAALLMLSAAPSAFAAKTDVVTLRNGDRITGEVKELLYGQLKYSTDDIGTIYIEWDNVAALKSDQYLQVEMLDGRRVYGRAIESGAGAGKLTLRGSAVRGGPESIATADLVDVVRITTLDAGNWLNRLDGSVSLGYTFTAATEVSVMTVGASVGTRTRERNWSIDLDAQFTDEGEEDSSRRASLVGTLERPIRLRSYYEGTLEFTTNQELELDLRSLVGATLGHYLVQGQGREWRIGAGLAASTEQLSDGQTQESLEGQISTSVRMFRLDAPHTNIDASLVILPSLTESGRVRGELDLSLRHELVKDLFFEISVYDSYDNRSTEGAPSNDWGMSTSLGYTF